MMLCHYNPNMAHQVRWAKAFSDAGCAITPHCGGEADIHIVQGPWFALKTWANHPRVLWLDRAFWGDPDVVTLGWKRGDTRVFAWGPAVRDKPAMLPWKTREDSALILADYNQDVSDLAAQARQRFGYVYTRFHPATKAPCHSLQADLMMADVCVGHSSTALVEAIVLGVPVICTDPLNAVAPVAVRNMDADLYRGDRDARLHKISWMQWHIDEIRDGTALRHLL